MNKNQVIQQIKSNGNQENTTSNKNQVIQQKKKGNGKQENTTSIIDNTPSFLDLRERYSQNEADQL